MRLSHKIRSIEGSRTVAFTALIQQLRRSGREVIDFAVGEPEMDTPREIVESTKAALDAQKTRYGPVNGLPELRARLAAGLCGYDAENILVTNGSKQALYMIFQVICDPMDEVIIPVPFWVSFVEQVKLAGGKPILVRTHPNHQLDCEAIEQAITARTKAILINSPNNPSGAVYPLTDLKTISRLAKKYNLFIVSDEAYDAFIYDGFKHASMFDIQPARNRTIITCSFSKSYSMTGFRVGYVAASTKIVDSLSRIQSHISGNVCTFAQYGALAAMSLDGAMLTKRQEEMQRKRDIAFKYASKLFKCIQPRGAFYLFPDVSMVLGEGEKADILAARLLKEAGVAVVSGEAFGMERHIRISFAVTDDKLIEGFEKIAGVL